jgi:hypothetical protein
MALPPYQISRKIDQAVQKLLVGDTQTDWKFDKLTLICGKQAKNKFT